MPLLECKLGHTQQPMGGQVYSFDRDAAGRYVANVYDERHAACFISAGTYREVPPLPANWQAGMDVPAPADEAQPAPSVPQLLSGTALMMKMVEAGSLELFDHEDKVYLASTWPSTLAVDDAVILEVPDILSVDDAGVLHATVTNGTASYTLLGKMETNGLYSLAGGSTFTAPPEVEEDDPKGLIDVKGIGPGMVKALDKEGITTLDQLVALNPDQRKALDDKLKGAPTKGLWFEQAAELLKPAS